MHNHQQKCSLSLCSWITIPITSPDRYGPPSPSLSLNLHSHFELVNLAERCWKYSFNWTAGKVVAFNNRDLQFESHKPQYCPCTLLLPNSIVNTQNKWPKLFVKNASSHQNFFLLLVMSSSFSIFRRHFKKSLRVV